MAGMIVKKYKLHYLITLFTVILFLVLSFLPVLPYWIQVGVSDDPVVGAIVELKYFIYFDMLINAIRSSNVVSYIFSLAMVGFYVTSILTIIFVLAQNNTGTKVSLLLGAIVNLVTIFTISYITSFSIAGFVAYFAMFIICLAFDHSELTKSDKDYLLKLEKMKKIGLNIKNSRLEKHITQQELADRIYISRSLVAKFETGKSQPSEKQICDIAKALDIDSSVIKSL